MGHPEIEYHMFEYTKKKGYVTLNRLLRYRTDLDYFTRICGDKGYNVFKSEKIIGKKVFTTFELEHIGQKGYIDGVEAMPCMVKITDLTNRKGELGCRHYKQCYNHTKTGRCRIGRLMELVEQELDQKRMERIKNLI